MRNFKFNKAVALLLVLACVMCTSACGSSEAKDLWENATHKEDVVLGSGEITVYVEVRSGQRSVTFTIQTDKTTLGDALLEHSLIDGEMGDYGLYLKTVNGMRADYDIDRTYWGFYKNGEYMLTGVDGTEIKDGEHYELVQEKG